LVKQIINKEGNETDECPYKVQMVSLEGKYDSYQSDAMHKGNYGEYLLLGRNRDGDAVVEPKTDKRKGTPLIDYERILEQCTVHVPNYLSKYQININESNVQVPVWKVLNDTDGNPMALVCAHMDIFPSTIMWECLLYKSPSPRDS